MSAAVSDGMPVRPTAVKVPSRTREGVEYTVTLPGCDCKGWRYRGRCAHVQEIVYGPVPVSQIAVPAA